MNVLTTHAEAEAWAVANLRARTTKRIDVMPTPFSRAGLTLELEPKQIPRWRFQGRTLGNMQRMTLEEAYARMIEKRAAAVAPAEVKQKPVHRPTLNEVFDEWASNRENKPSTRPFRSVWKNVVGERGGVVMADMTQRDYVAILVDAHDAGAAPSSIHRAGQLMRQIVKWADLRKGIAPVNVPAVADIFDGDNPPPKSEPRQAVIRLEDYVAFYQGLPNTSAANCLRLIMVTGVRKSEATGAHHDEHTAEGWLIPAARMKQRKEHFIPAFDALRDVVALSRRENGLLFGADRTGKPDSKQRLSEMSLNGVIRRRGLKAYIPAKPNPIEVDATVHDLRRSFCSYLVKYCEIDEITANRMIAHKVQINAVSGAYIVDGFAHEEKIAEGWRKWDRFWRDLIGI
ncbi:hypothetical protein CUW27_20730 [Salmonella enterica]|nr:hypothetical protein [Salmonella enterica]